MEVKFKYVLLALCSLATVISCRKMHEETQAVNIDLSTEYQVYKIGEPVSFKIDSNADFLTFYSGEEGSKYEYHDVNRVVDAGIALSFMTSTSSGLAGSPNPSILPVSYSNDFSGIYTEEEMAKATWIDITERFNFPEDTGISDCKSGNVDISDLFESDDRALYFRFEYTVQAYEAGLKNSRTQWIVNSLAFINNFLGYGFLVEAVPAGVHRQSCLGRNIRTSIAKLGPPVTNGNNRLIERNWTAVDS